MADTYVGQVGGTHYQSEYQHWDWATDVKLPYLEGCATKYISRWRSSKGEGVKDLRKGLSYIDKMLKVYAPSFQSRIRDLPVPYAVILALTARFEKANGLDYREGYCCQNIAAWQTLSALTVVRSGVFMMIEQAEGPPPRTDSNKHAGDPSAD